VKREGYCCGIPLFVIGIREMFMVTSAGKKGLICNESVSSLIAGNGRKDV
jgi:hypothetical protein